MMAFFSPGPLELWILMLFGGAGVGGNLASLPPLPEDKGLVSAAPEECLFYLGWYGAAGANGNSRNHTEQLLAEPEVRKCISTLWREIKKAAGEEPEAAVILPILETVLTRPASLFVSKVVVLPQADTVDVQAGVVVNAGGKADSLRRSLQRLETMLLKELREDNAQEVTVAGVKLRELPVPPPAPAIQWGFHGEYLIVAIGEGSAEKIIKSLKAASGPPAWLKQIHQRLPVERPASVQYLNVKGILDVVKPFTGREIARVLSALGLDNLESHSAVFGMDGQGVVTKGFLKTDGKPRGLFNLSGDEPLDAKHLAAIPRDATWAVACRLDAAETYKKIFDMIGDVDPRARDEAEEGVKDAERGLGLKLLGDVLQPLGDSVCVYNAPSEGGLLVTGVNMVVQLRNAAKFRFAHNLAIRLVRNADEEHDDFALREFTFRGQKVYSTNYENMPIAPSWCITDDELVLGLYPQTVKAYLSRGKKGESLADVPEVAQALKDKPNFLGYQNTPELFQFFYPFVKMFAPVVAHEARREGMDLDAALLPSASAIHPHLRPSTITSFRREDGIGWVARETAPGANSVVTSAFFLFAMVRPARGDAVFEKIAEPKFSEEKTESPPPPFPKKEFKERPRPPRKDRPDKAPSKTPARPSRRF